MTTNGDTATTPSTLRFDGIPVDNLAAATAVNAPASEREEDHRFWASHARFASSTHREIMEVSFGSLRIINYLSFRVSRFPLTMKVEYLDVNGDWQAFTYAHSTHHEKPRRHRYGLPVGLSISESVPSKVNSAQAATNPQHFGRSHWMEESWRVVPVRTRRIRFIFVRNSNGTPPRDYHGQHVPYSIALKRLQIGYRVTSPDDIPNNDPWWATTTDILGSQMVMTTYEQPAVSAIDGDLRTYWRSEPQPFPFAVVPFYLDVTQPDGSTPTLDRFWVDPVTLGVTCNLYYCNDAPLGSFWGLDDPIPAQYRTEVGVPAAYQPGGSSYAVSIDLGPTERTGVSLDNTFLGVDFSQPWWVGIDAASLVDAAGPNSYPIISLGTTRVLQEGGVIKVLAQSGESAEIVLDPTLHGTNTDYRLVIAYHPPDPASQRDAYLHLTYQIPGFDPQTAESVVLPLLAGGQVRIGLHTDPANTDVPAIRVKGLVVKTEALTDDTEAWFLDEGVNYLLPPLTPYEDRGTTQNAKIRMLPSERTDNNLFGVVGGPGDQFSAMTWTPINRDYTLRQGYMDLPPTKARYWKFELTGLVPEVYDNFLSIDRDVLVFPPNVVAQASADQADNQSSPMGTTANGDAALQVLYDDALAALGSSTAPAEATQVLVVKNPQQAAQVAKNGWIWTYQPWHSRTAPRFTTIGQHSYESLHVDHITKVAYFAGIKEIQPIRLDYTYEDDTPEYVDHLLDSTWVESSSGVEFLPEGGVVATGASAEIVSVDLPSYRPVRGVQFATQETGPVQSLDDPDLTDSTLGEWSPYGDADVTWLGTSDVRVDRGWLPNTYADLEAQTYADLETGNWGQVEGNAQTSGIAEGGIEMVPFAPLGAGRMTALAKISASANLSVPVVLEIVSSYDDRVVASTSRRLGAGETATLRVTFVDSAITDFYTWGQVETLVSAPTTYGQLEGDPYYQLESTGIYSTYYLRIRQVSGTTDTFHVHRVRLFNDSIAWFFSNDGGTTWQQAVGVRNDPHGVLMFPAHDVTTPESTRTLKWKARFYREGAGLSAIYIRPWYGSRSKTFEPLHDLTSVGPNRSPGDVMPALNRHPMWVNADGLPDSLLAVGETPTPAPSPSEGGPVYYTPPA